MDFWENVTKSITDAADQTKKSTEKLATSAMLKYRISTLKTKLSNDFKKLGELKFAEMNGEESDADEIKAKFDEIALTKKKLAVLEKRVADLDDFISCPQCGYRVRRGLALCPYCEYAFEKETEAEETTLPVAPLLGEGKKDNG